VIATDDGIVLVPGGGACQRKLNPVIGLCPMSSTMSLSRDCGLPLWKHQYRLQYLVENGRRARKAIAKSKYEQVGPNSSPFLASLPFPSLKALMASSTLTHPSPGFQYSIPTASVESVRQISCTEERLNAA